MSGCDAEMMLGWGVTFVLHCCPTLHLLFTVSPATRALPGIREGGRTGVTALVVAFGFFVSLFFSPLIASIPPYATGPALVLVGAMMMENVSDIDWGDVRVR